MGVIVAPFEALNWRKTNLRNIRGRLQWKLCCGITIAGDLDESIEYSPISGHPNQFVDGLFRGASIIFGGRC